MKYAYAALFAAALARAQSRDDIPECAISCLDDAIQSETDCAVDDYACVCENFDSIQGSATGCVIDSCGAEVALNEVLPAVEALCANVPTDTGSETQPTETSAVETMPTEQPTEEPTQEPTEEPTEPTAEPTVEPTTAPAPPAPTNGTNTQPPEPVPTAGAAAFAPIGGIALAGLLGLAL